MVFQKQFIEQIMMEPCTKKKVQLERLLSDIENHGSYEYSEIIKNMDVELRNTYLLAMYMSRMGRVNESSSGTYKKDSADLFKQYATLLNINKDYIDEAAFVLSNMTQVPTADYNENANYNQTLNELR